jgi:excisionase family DNA binding protein
MAVDLMTVEQATQALGISRSTLWRRLRSGSIQSVRRSGRRLVQLPTGLKATRVKVAGGVIPPFTEDHPIFRLVGAGRGGGQQPGARDKHAILDE